MASMRLTAEGKGTHMQTAITSTIELPEAPTGADRRAEALAELKALDMRARPFAELRALAMDTERPKASIQPAAR